MADTTQPATAETKEQKLTAAVESAVAQMEEEPTVEVEEEESETNETAETEGSEGDEDELDEESRSEALRLYKALKGPQSVAILAALAQQAGLLGKGVPETKREEQAAKKEIKSILEDALGPEYKFLSDKLEKGLSQIFAQERAEQQEHFAQIQTAQVEREVVEVTKQLNAETKGDYSKYEERIVELSKEIPAGEMGVRKYLNRLYAIAKSEGTKTSTKAITDRINKNRTDAPARLRTTSAPAQTKAGIPDKKMSLNESVAFALGELTKGNK